MVIAHLTDVLSDPQAGGILAGQFPNGHTNCGSTGVLRSISSGREYPVLGGIAIFSPALLSRGVLQSAREGNFEQCAERALMAGGHSRGDARRILRSLKAPRSLQFRGSPCGNAKGNENMYYRYRYSLPDAPACIGIASCLKRTGASRGYLLDVGCGLAHFYRYYLRSYEPEKIVLLDKSLEALLTASRFVDSRTLLVCADADDPLPFSRGLFEDVVSLDGFPHFQAKTEFLQGAVEMLDPHAGTLWLTRNPNPCRAAECPEGSRPPSAWRDALDQDQWRLFPDRQFAEPVLVGETISLVPNYVPRDEASLWSTFTLAYSNAPWDRDNKYVPLNLAPDLDHLCVNSIYSILSFSEESKRFIKSAPAFHHPSEDKEMVRVELPDVVDVPARQVKKNYASYAALARSLVMVESLGVRCESYVTLRVLAAKSRVASYLARARWFNAVYSMIPVPMKALGKRLLVG